MKKSLFLVALALFFVQAYGFERGSKTFGGVIATLHAGHTKEKNGCELENTNDHPVEVSYTITFLVGADLRKIEKSGKIVLAPAGTRKVKGQPTARYWITAGEECVVIGAMENSELMRCIVKRANSY
jgi:hypothetical protein